MSTLAEAAAMPDIETGSVVVDLWLKPVQSSIKMAMLTAEKPVGQMTPGELLAWFNVLGYGTLSGLLAITVIWNLGRVAVGGRR